MSDKKSDEHAHHTSSETPARVGGVLYSGTGNTFVLVDNRKRVVRTPEALALAACREHGMDGLLLIETSAVADFRMRILNADGSEASMCGNGSRCAAHWAAAHMKLRKAFRIETRAGVLEASVKNDRARIRLTDPQGLSELDDFVVPAGVRSPFFVNTGVPHLVTEVRDLPACDVVGAGRRIRNDRRFAPEGTNAVFFERLGPSRIRVRVYERGVENETASCGTGSTAAALASARFYGDPSPVEVEVRFGEKLKIYFDRAEDVFRNVCLEGRVEVLGLRDIPLDD